MAEFNVPLIIANENNAAIASPFSLSPGQISSFEARLRINYGTYQEDVSGLAVPYITFNGTGFTATASHDPLPINLYSLDTANFISFSVTATGANTYVPVEYTGTFTVSALSPYISGNARDGLSTETQEVSYTSNPAICTLNIVFSTLNVSPCAVTTFAAVPSGNNSSIGLTWTNPNPLANGLSGFQINYTTNRFPSARDDGTAVSVESAINAKYFSNLDNVGDIIYGFTIWAADMGSEYSTAVYASAVSVNAATSEITSFTATNSGNAQILLTWTNPDSQVGASLSAIQINYTYGRLPSAVDDGTIYYLTSATTSKFMSGLLNETYTPHGFAAWAIDTDNQRSAVAYASSIPIWQTGNRAWPSHAEHKRMWNMGYI